MGDAYTMAIARSRLRGMLARNDADPSKWPVAPGAREYMVDCEFCPSRMPVRAMTFHIRRHMRRGDVGQGVR